MFGLPILEVAIGLCFLYLLLSLICSTVNEAIAALTGRRGDMLAQAIGTLLGDANLKEKLYSHPLIKSLSPGGSQPSYIPAQKFSLALMDILTGEGKSAGDEAALLEGLTKTNPHLNKVLSTVFADTRAHLATNQQKIEAWYDDAMDRVSGCYKRKTTLWIWIIALAITLSTNADTFRIGKALWVNQAVRSAVVDAAQARAQAEQRDGATPLVEYSDPQNPESSTVLKVEQQALTASEKELLGDLLPTWSADMAEMQLSSNKLSWWGAHLLGLFFTLVALSMGAPFWFDMLNKFINIRNSGKAPERSSAQPPPPPAQTAAKGAGV